MELFFHSSLVAYWTPTDLGGWCLSFSVIFLLSHFVHGVLKPRILKRFAIPFCKVPHFIRPWLARTCLQPLPVAGWHAWCPGCPIAGPCSVCRPSQAAACLSMCCPAGWSQGPAGVARKGVYRRLEPRLEDAQEWRAPWPCFCCWPTWGQSAACMALCWLSSGPSFPPLKFLGIIIQTQQVRLPGRECAVLLGLLPHPAGNLGRWLLPCSCLDLPMISVKLLPLPKIATWSNTNALILMYKAKYSKLKYILAPR